MKDRNGTKVEIGDVVRVVEVSEEFLDLLPDDERSHIEGMLNNEYAIDDFPEAGKASVSIWFEFGDGSHGFGGLYMLPHEFELVRKAKT